jgi:hypothetical protein
LRQNTRAARTAAGEWWICHRNIVNLKSRASLAAPFKSAARRQCHDFDPSRSFGPRPAGQLLPSACNLPARTLAGVSTLASNPAGRQPAPACPRNPQAIGRWSRQNAPLNQ